MTNADIISVGPTELELVVSLYNDVFQPSRDMEYFKRRYQNRTNVLTLIAEVDHRPVGFCCGLELTPRTWYAWLVGILPDFRRLGVASQLHEAEQAWAAEHGYIYMRMECYNGHRPVLHLAISHGFDVVGVRWDNERNANLVILEKEILDRR